MNRLGVGERANVISCLVEGNSIRATCRITGVAKNTVVKLLRDIGEACAIYQDEAFVDLPCKRIQCDEIWSFVGCKEKNLKAGEKKKGRGDVWTWTAICQDTKLVPAFFVGNRDAEAAYHFMNILAGRLKNRVQMTTDGHQPYIQAIEDAFGSVIDYAQLVKVYGAPLTPGERTRYTQPECIGVKTVAKVGKPDMKNVTTSHCERHNLTMRMQMRRFTRMTNAFSKKIENLKHAVALHTMHYNYCRIHSSIRVTPAMETGLSDHVWSLEELVGLLEG
jgi:IS1 family transposase